MARVNVEERFLIHAQSIAYDLDVSTFEAVGRMVFLWHASQDMERVSGSSQDIKRWARLDEHQVDHFITVLLNHGLLRKLAGDEFEIAGNTKHAQNLKEWKEKSSVGGKTRSKSAKRDEKGRMLPVQPSSSQRENESPAKENSESSRASSALHYKSLQVSSLQDKSLQELSISADGAAEAKPKKPKALETPEKKSEISQVWAAYKTAYIERYNQEPAYSAKNYKLCGTIIDRIGFEAAKSVVRFYLQHNDSWYVKTCHMIDYCAKNADALLTQMRANFKVTSTFAQQQDKSQNNQQIFDEVLSIWNAREEAKDDAAGA